MIYIPIFFLEVLLLWLTARATNRYVMNRIPIWLYVVLFFPGTLFHELAHYLMAKLLFVKVGRFTLLPKKIEKEIILGSVSIEQTGAVKRLLVGVAPMLFGITLVILTIYVSFENNLHQNGLATFLVGYLLFVISNSMFSSKKDLEGAWKIVLMIAILSAILYLLGVRINISLNNYEFVKLASYYLLVPIAVNSLIIAILAKIPYR